MTKTPPNRTNVFFKFKTDFILYNVNATNATNMPRIPILEAHKKMQITKKPNINQENFNN